jgi:hypothetical protein
MNMLKLDVNRLCHRIQARDRFRMVGMSQWRAGQDGSRFPS